MRFMRHLRLYQRYDIFGSIIIKHVKLKPYRRFCGIASAGKNAGTRSKAHKDILKYMRSRKHTHSVPGKIVSATQPFTHPIMGCKAGKSVAFGAKLDICAFSRTCFADPDLLPVAAKNRPLFSRDKYTARSGKILEKS